MTPLLGVHKACSEVIVMNNAPMATTELAALLAIHVALCIASTVMPLGT